MFQYNVYVREVQYGREAGQAKYHHQHLDHLHHHRHLSLTITIIIIPTMMWIVQAKHERSAGADSYTVSQLVAGTQHQVVTIIMVVMVMLVLMLVMVVF